MKSTLLVLTLERLWLSPATCCRLGSAGSASAGATVRSNSGQKYARRELKSRMRTCWKWGLSGSRPAPRLPRGKDMRCLLITRKKAPAGEAQATEWWEPEQVQEKLGTTLTQSPTARGRRRR
jgi:hypothetical protein